MKYDLLLYSNEEHSDLIEWASRLTPDDDFDNVPYPDWYAGTTWLRYLTPISYPALVTIPLNHLPFIEELVDGYCETLNIHGASLCSQIYYSEGK